MFVNVFERLKILRLSFMYCVGKLFYTINELYNIIYVTLDIIIVRANAFNNISIHD